jgi:proton-coupled amino acid transporter
MIYTPLCYVRKIEKFSYFHIFADVVIFFTVCCIIGYTISYGLEHGIGEGVVFINTSSFLDIIGFAVYSYEGVGIMLPVRDITLHKEDYKKVLICVMTTTFLSYTLFGVFCYIIYGTSV